jgi:hypothetical protein
MPGLLQPSDVGFRKFNPIAGNGRSAAQIADWLKQWDAYDVDGEMIRRHGRRIGTQFTEMLRIQAVFDSRSALDRSQFNFVDDYFRDSVYQKLDVTRLQADHADTLRNLAAAPLKGEDRAIALRMMLDGVMLAGRNEVVPYLMDHAFPTFFSLYPKGRIVAVLLSDRFDHAAAALRCLYAASQAPDQDLQELRKQFVGMSMLQNWHSGSLLTAWPLYFSILNHLFYPFVSAVRGGPPGLDFVFLFDPAEAYSPRRFPRSWLASGSSVADFGKEGFDVFAAIEDFKGPKWQDAAHQRVRCTSAYSAIEQEGLLRWYVEHLNRFLFELTDLANFTKKPDGFIDPVFAFEHFLTIDRLARQTLLSMTLEETGAAKGLIFAGADIFGALAQRHGYRNNDTEFFKDLFDRTFAPDAIEKASRPCPSLSGLIS